MPIPQKQLDSYDVDVVSDETVFIAVKKGKTINITGEAVDDFIKDNTTYITHEYIDKLFTKS